MTDINISTIEKKLRMKKNCEFLSGKSYLHYPDNFFLWKKNLIKMKVVKKNVPANKVMDENRYIFPEGEFWVTFPYHWLAEWRNEREVRHRVTVLGRAG